MREFKHPLALLRFVVDMTQAEFGASIGVSESYVKAIEIGQRSLSGTVIDAIIMQFGVSSEFLETPLPSNPNKLKSTVFLVWQQVEYWRGYVNSYNRDAVDAFQELHLPQIQALVLAAMEKGNATALLMSLDRWMANALEEFGLRKSFETHNKHAYEPYARRSEELFIRSFFNGIQLHQSRNWSGNAATYRSEKDEERENTIDALHEWIKDEGFSGLEDISPENAEDILRFLPARIANAIGWGNTDLPRKEKFEALQEAVRAARDSVRSKANDAAVEGAKTRLQARPSTDLQSERDRGGKLTYSLATKAPHSKAPKAKSKTTPPPKQKSPRGRRES